MHRTCVIHHECVLDEAQRRSPYSKEGRLASRAWDIIGPLVFGAREETKNVVIYKHGDPRDVAELFDPGETVVLMGAYRGVGACLTQARGALIDKGVRCLYHAYGSIPIFPVDPLIDNIPLDQFYLEDLFS